MGRFRLVLGLALWAAAATADDDLAVIKKAVGPEAAAEATPAPASATRKSEPQWLRVRILDKHGKRSRVSVNLPLSFVRAVGTDWPLHIGQGCNEARELPRCSMRLGEILKQLESGQDIVEIDDESSTVRVWVE